MKKLSIQETTCMDSFISANKYDNIVVIKLVFH